MAVLIQVDDHLFTEQKKAYPDYILQCLKRTTQKSNKFRAKT